MVMSSCAKYMKPWLDEAYSYLKERGFCDVDNFLVMTYLPECQFLWTMTFPHNYTDYDKCYLDLHKSFNSKEAAIPRRNQIL